MHTRTFLSVLITHAVLLMDSCRFLCVYSVIVSVFIFLSLFN